MKSKYILSGCFLILFLLAGHIPHLAAERQGSEQKGLTEESAIEKVNAQLKNLEDEIKAGQWDSVNDTITKLASKYQKDPAILQNIGSWYGRHKRKYRGRTLDYKI